MADTRTHKAPKSFYFDFSNAPQTASEIIERINKKKYDNLDRFLKSIEWELVADELIQTIDLRHFTRCIADEEVRLDVMKFLKKYAKQYFRKAAEDLEYNENVRVASTVSIVQEYTKSADEYLELFENELGFLIDQLEECTKYTGDRFKKQEKRIKELEKQIEELKTANINLQAKVDHFEHPEKYGKYIPTELRNRQFQDIMAYLQKKQIVLPIYGDGDYGRLIQCYRWYGSKGLFGYYVERLNEEFELNEAREQRNWQIFESVFENYDKLVDEARKAVSKYRKNNKALLPAKADFVDEAIKYANGELKNAQIVRI